MTSQRWIPVRMYELDGRDLRILGRFQYFHDIRVVVVTWNPKRGCWVEPLSGQPVPGRLVHYMDIPSDPEP